MSTSSTCSARRTTSSGTVSCWRTPVIRSMTSLSDSRCCTFSVDSTVMPAARMSSTSCQRLACREPGALVCASSSIDHHGGAAGQHGVHVELGQLDPAVGQLAPGQHLEALEQRGGPGPAVRLDQPDHDVGAAVGPPVGLAEHGEGLPDARCGAEVDPQLARVTASSVAP